MRHHGFSCSSLYTVTPEQAQENLLIENADDDVVTLLEDQTSNLDGRPLSELVASLANTFELPNSTAALPNRRRVTLLVTRASVRLADGTQHDFPVPPAPLPADSGVTQPGASADIRLTMTTRQPGISALEILVVTRRAVLRPHEVQSQTVVLGSVNAQQTMPLPLKVRQQAIPIRMLYTRQDDALGQPALLTALGRAGWLLYRAAAQQGIDLDQPSPTTNATTAFIREAGTALALPGAPLLRTRFSADLVPESPNQTRYRLTASGLPLVTSVQLESAPYVWEDDAFRKREGAAADRIASKRRARIKRIAEEEQTQLDVLSRQLTAQANGWEVLTDFRKRLTERHEAVFAVAPPQAVPDGDDYIVRLAVQSRTPPILTIQAGGSYSVEDGLTADAAVTGDNYWNQTANFALHAKAGTEVQRAHFTGQITRSFNRYFRAVYSVEARIVHDPRQALGDTPHLTVEERETGVQPKISLRYDSSEGLSAALRRWT